MLAAVPGCGLLRPFLDDPEVEELWVNQGSRVFGARCDHGDDAVNTSGAVGEPNRWIRKRTLHRAEG